VDAGPAGPLVPAALEAGVLYVPGEFGHVADEAGVLPRNECRLSFGVADPDRVREGIRRLRTAYRTLERAGGRVPATV
jgi:2-aminoadipate transaminase